MRARCVCDLCRLSCDLCARGRCIPRESDHENRRTLDRDNRWAFRGSHGLSGLSSGSTRGIAPPAFALASPGRVRAMRGRRREGLRITTFGYQSNRDGLLDALLTVPFLYSLWGTGTVLPRDDQSRRFQPAGVRQSRPARSSDSSASPRRSFLTPSESRSFARVNTAPGAKRSSTCPSRLRRLPS